MNATKVLKADEHRVGISLTMEQGTFKKLLKLSATPDMDGWSEALVRLIERSTP